MKRPNYDVQKIKDLYIKGLSCKKVGDIFNISGTTIREILIEEKVKIRSFRDSHLTKIFNESFFDDIDTEDKAYWLGFFYADGCIRINTHKAGYLSYIISLGQMEKEVLDKFIQSIDYV